MRTRLLVLVLLAVAGNADATDTFGAGHRVIADGEPGAPVAMAWRYRLLNSAQTLFDARAATQAPGATLAFRLPKVEAAQGENHVEIVEGERHIPLTMVSNTTFTLPRDVDAAADAQVVVNRTVPKGEMNHPVVQVRSPGLPDGVRRLGDLRLACAAQMAMLKAEGLKVRALFSAASLFGLDICDDLDVTKIDDPTVRYDTVTIEDGGRRLSLPAKQAKAPKLSDKDWSDNARITYTLNDHIVQ